MAGRYLALPLDVEQVLPLLRRLLRLHLGGVVGDGDQTGGRGVIEAGGIEVLEGRHDLRRSFRDVLLEAALGAQAHVVADVGRREDVADRLVVLDILEQALIGDLRRRAHDIDLDAVHLGEASAEILRALRRVVRDVPGDLAFLLGALLEILDVRMRRRRKGERCDDREPCQPLHRFLPEHDPIIVGGGIRSHDAIGYKRETSRTSA